ncbi:VanZ family protein [Pseudonocardia zijingensis]|uniref:VanZ-like domain-containing protein n=1 Tax=Pseudonocardia zijingensis TaxID=153376 RepID=A0ABN1PSN2_9PSEU
MRGGNIWFSPIPVAAVACVVLVVLVALAMIDSPRGRTCVRWLLVLCVGGILVVTMLRATAGTGVTNLYPGRTIGEQLTGDHALGLFNVLGNIAMFVPLGWLVALVAPRRRLVGAAVVGVGLSATIEIVQLFVGRIADIDDVLLNGTGAVLGAGVALIIREARARVLA